MCILNPTFTAFLPCEIYRSPPWCVQEKIPSLAPRFSAACRSQQETAQAEAQKLKAVEVIAGFRDHQRPRDRIFGSTMMGILKLTLPPYYHHLPPIINHNQLMVLPFPKKRHKLGPSLPLLGRHFSDGPSAVCETVQPTAGALWIFNANV